VDGRNYFRAFYEVARHAKRYICIAGWQFERSAALLRGADAKAAGGEVIVASFLDELCRVNESLRVYILMWDFSPLVAFDKEWFNKLVLDLTASERIQFRFDSNHALYASHHQKLVVIDGVTAFVGGLDIAANSWDDRLHWAENAERVRAGEEYEPYHDVQSLCTGAAAWELTRFFEQRWVRAGGAALGLPQPSGEQAPLPVRKMMPLAAVRVAISETRAQTLIPMLGPVMHIRQLYLDAIEAAERLIFLENQYFSSQAVYQALKDRLIDHDRPCPQIVLVLPKRMHTLIEDISLSVVQAKMLRSLSEIAEKNKRDLGIYYTAAALTAALGPEKSTYIHSKVLIVDDRLLSVGSANITNRSMGMDTELNLSWEAAPDDRDLVRSIRRVRANLLAEHTGLRRLSERRALGSMDNLVKYLNDHADRLNCRLRRHTMSSFLEEASWIKDLMPDDLSFDPERPLIEESINEAISRDRNSIFAKGLVLLNELALEQPGELLTASDGPAAAAIPGPEPRNTRKLNNRGVYRWYGIAAIVLGVAGIVWLLLDP
jgi:phosphatidylserine/phosphatidylglycerophosphate/cardiolipin synthase-like enzyme